MSRFMFNDSSFNVVCDTYVDCCVRRVGHYIYIVCFVHALKISPLASLGRNDIVDIRRPSIDIFQQLQKG